LEGGGVESSDGRLASTWKALRSCVLAAHYPAPVASLPVWPVQLQQIHVVQAQPCQAGVQRRRDVGCVEAQRPSPQPVHSPRARHLGGHNQLGAWAVALPPQPGAQDLL
jgi:hypothetical protein